MRKTVQPPNACVRPRGARAASPGRGESPEARPRPKIMGPSSHSIAAGLFLSLWGCASTSVATSAPVPSAQAAVVEVPGPRPPEHLSYTITHSLAGQVGDISLVVNAAANAEGRTVWNGQGQGGGSFMGFGTKSKFSTTYDPQARYVSAWTLHRDTGSAIILDEAAQTQPGVVNTHRQRSDKPEEWATLSAGAPTYDPFGYLLALRTHGQTASWTAPVLEGRALWSVTAQQQQAETITLKGQKHAAVRYRLAAQPIDWQGKPSTSRKPRTMTVWLSATPARTPLALKTAAPLGELLVELRLPAAKVAQR